MTEQPQEDPEASKRPLFRTKMMRQLTQPRELKSALLKVLTSEYIQRKCKLSLIPDDDFIDNLVTKVEEDLAGRAKILSEAEKLLKKDDRRTLASALQNQMMILVTSMRDVLAKEFRVDVEDLNERLVMGILGVDSSAKIEESKKGTILIIDDTKQTRRILRTFLTKHGYTVIEAEDGEEGLYSLGKNKIDLILADVSMPKMNGKEFLRYIKSNPTFKSIPIIMVSAQGDTQTVRETITLGALDFIVKPFKSAVVIDKIVKTLASKPTESSS